MEIIHKYFAEFNFQEGFLKFFYFCNIYYQECEFKFKIKKDIIENMFELIKYNDLSSKYDH